MHEADDRLAGDLVWELFPAPPTQPRRNHVLYSIEVAFLVVLTWFISQPLSVLIACLAISLKDFREGWRLARAIPDKAGGRICSLFTYSWGSWKLGIAGFAVFVLSTMNDFQMNDKTVSPRSMTTVVLMIIGFSTSAFLAAVGLVEALRSGMRVWIGKGVNQAKTLLYCMLIVVFAYFWILPFGFWFPPAQPGTFKKPTGFPFALIGFLVCLFGSPAVILLALEWACRRVVADQPGKFGSKVPAVGKWNK